MPVDALPEKAPGDGRRASKQVVTTTEVGEHDETMGNSIPPGAVAQISMDKRAQDWERQSCSPRRQQPERVEHLEVQPLALLP